MTEGNDIRVSELEKQIEFMSPDDDMFQVIKDEINMLKKRGVYSKYKNGGLARRKRNIARGCGAIMENRRKKTLYT